MDKHLERPVLLHICRDGTVTARTEDEPVFNGVAMPFFSVESKEEARKLIVLTCSVQREKHPLLPDETWYTVPGFGGEVEDIEPVADKFAQYYEVMVKQKTAS